MSIKEVIASKIKSRLACIDDLPTEVESSAAGFDRDWVESVSSRPADFPMADLEDALVIVRDWIDGLPAPHKDRINLAAQ